MTPATILKPFKGVSLKWWVSPNLHHPKMLINLVFIFSRKKPMEIVGGNPTILGTQKRHPRALPISALELPVVTLKSKSKTWRHGDMFGERPNQKPTNKTQGKMGVLTWDERIKLVIFSEGSLISTKKTHLNQPLVEEGSSRIMGFREFFPGKYHQNGRFSMAILVYQRLNRNPLDFHQRRK